MDSLRTLQQYLLRQLRNARLAFSSSSSSGRNNGAGAASCGRGRPALPDELWLNIFSYLSARDLCVCNAVCIAWSSIARDEILWAWRLDCDAPRWSWVTHRTSLARHAALGAKQRYLTCSPNFYRNVPASLLNWRTFTKVMKTMVDSTSLKFVAFGAGAERKKTGKLLTRMMGNNDGVFTPIQMIPGTDGVGTGLTYRMKYGHHVYDFNMILLYSADKYARELQPPQRDRIRDSRLFEPITGQQDVATYAPEVRPAVRTILQSVDGLIYVQDSSMPEAEIRETTRELQAFLRAAPTDTPLLVVPTVCPNETAGISPVVYIERFMDLHTENDRQWLITNCNSRNLEELSKAIRWLMEVSHSRERN